MDTARNVLEALHRKAVLSVLPMPLKTAAKRQLKPKNRRPNETYKLKKGGAHVQTNLRRAKTMTADYRCIPISRRMLSDIATPVQVLKLLKSISRHCYLMESLEDSDKWGRYTFLVYDPKLELTCQNGTVHISAGTELTKEATSPDSYLRKTEKYSSAQGRELWRTACRKRNIRNALIKPKQS